MHRSGDHVRLQFCQATGTLCGALITTVAVSTFCLMLCGVSVAQSVVERSIGPGFAPLANPHFDILVVTVVEMEAGNFTNARPPRGKVQIDEVLRGPHEGGIVDASWRASATIGDYDPPPQNKAGQYTPGRLKPEWYERPLLGPKVGERLIICKVDRQPDGSFLIQFSFAFSEANRAVVLEKMAPAEREDWTQAAAFFAIVLSPVFSLICLMRLRLTELSRAGRRMLTAAILVIPVLALGIYGYYESGISIYSNIRIDVLVLWPALALAFAFWLVLGYWHLVRLRRKVQ